MIAVALQVVIHGATIFPEFQTLTLKLIFSFDDALLERYFISSKIYQSNLIFYRTVCTCIIDGNLGNYFGIDLCNLVACSCGPVLILR